MSFTSPSRFDAISENIFSDIVSNIEGEVKDIKVYSDKDKLNEEEITLDKIQ